MTAPLLPSPILTIIGTILNNDKLTILGMLVPFALFLGVACSIQIIRYFECKTKIIGKCVGSTCVSSTRGHKTYAPTFEYKYNGEKYKSLSFIGYTLPKINKLFEFGNEYEIYINETEPNDVVDKRHFPPGFAVISIFLLIIMAIIVIVLFSNATVSLA